MMKPTVVPMMLALGALTACGGEEGARTGASGAGDEAAQVNEPSPAEAPAGGAASEGTLDYANPCDALDPEALTRIVGASLDRVENRDRSMMDSRIGDCRMFVSANEYLQVSLWDRAEDRFMVNRGGGEQAPLSEESRARTLDVADADRAVVLWANDDFESEFNNIRELVVDYGGRALGVSHGGLGPYRSPDTLLAVAERARQDLGW